MAANTSERLFDDVSWPTRGRKHGAQHLHERGSDYAACGRWINKPGAPFEAQAATEWDGALCIGCARAFLRLERQGAPVKRVLRPVAQMVRTRVAALEAGSRTQLRENLFQSGQVTVRPQLRSRPSALAERVAA